MDQTEIFRADSLKDLNRQINELRDAIVRLKSEGQDYTKQSQQLQAAERLKAEVMAMSKKEATALEGSYDALSKKLKELKREYHSTADEMKRAELAPQIREINDQLKKMDSDVGVFTRNVGNYASAFGQVRQVGGDLLNGFRAMSGALTLTTASQDRLNDSEKTFASVLGVVQGLKGIGGLIDGLKKYITTARAAKTAQDALNTSMSAGQAGAEGMGKSVSKLGAFLKQPEVILALTVIAEAVGIIVLKWDEVLARINKWFGWTQKSKEEIQELTSSYDDFNKELEKERRERNRTVKVMEAEKKSKKEILEFQAQEVRNNIRVAQSRMQNVFAQMQEIKGHGFLRRLLNKENSLYKDLETQFNQWSEKVVDFYEELKDINNDIKVGNITNWGEDDGGGGGGAKNQLDEIVRAAQNAKKEIDKILNSEDTELEKIRKKYIELRKEVYKYEQAEDKAAKTAKEHMEIQDRYNLVRKVLTKQETEERRQAYKNLFDTEYKAYQDRVGLLHKEIDEEKELYLGLASNITGFAQDQMIYQDSISNEKMNRLRADANEITEILKKNTTEQAEEYKQFYEEITEEVDGVVTISSRKVIALYDQMIAEGEKFKYKEPFRTALSEMLPKMTELETEAREKLKNFVTGTIDEIGEALDRGNYGIIPALFQKLLDNPPVKGSPELTAAVDNYMRQLYREIAETIADDENLDLKSKLNLLNLFFPEGGEDLMKARLGVINKAVTKYRDLTVETLNDVYNAWNNVIQAVDASIDRQLKEGKISQQEADRKKDQNKRAFKALKAFQITTAVINGLAASVQALIDPSVPNFYVRLANSISAAAMATAQVASISAQNYNGDTSSPGSVSAPTLVDRTPYTATVGLNPADFANAQAQNPIRAFVVDSDLKEGLDRYDERIEDTSF